MSEPVSQREIVEALEDAIMILTDLGAAKHSMARFEDVLKRARSQEKAHD